jgi:DNA-directed RNA polymerase subunit RPC12/RpoP
MMPKLVDYACPHCGLRAQARQASIGSMVRCKACGGKIALKGGCGCGSLVGVLAVVFIAVVVFSLIPGGKKPDQAQQPIPQPKNSAAPLPVKKAEEQKPDEPVAATDDSTPEPIVKEKSSEAAASEELRLAELLIGNDRISPARRRLQQLIEKYPETAAAAKAKKRLESLK